MPRPLQAAPGQTLESRFLLLEVIGRGGMSTVFKARDLENGDALVAVKVPLPQYSSGVGSPARVDVTGLANRLVAVTPWRKLLRHVRYVTVVGIAPIAFLVGSFRVLWWYLERKP